MFTFSKANTKLRKLELFLGVKVYSFDLLSGYTCPFAKDCFSKAVPDGFGSRYIEDGPEMKFRCFSASQEALYAPTFAMRERNTIAVKSLVHDINALSAALHAQLPSKAEVIRVHVAGDFFHQNYFLAWIEVAKLNPGKRFYAYTKALPFLENFGHMLPDNFKVTMSRGGKRDDLIEKLKAMGYWEARVVLSESSTTLPVDHDDSHAAIGGADFALVIHGTQPKKVAA